MATSAHRLPLAVSSGSTERAKWRKPGNAAAPPYGSPYATNTWCQMESFVAPKAGAFEIAPSSTAMYIMPISSAFLKSMRSTANAAR